jgi:predicted flap endonuclease-1-like 5' DNA nuclease
MTWLQENWIIAVVGLVVAVVLLWWLFGRAKPEEIAPPSIEPAKPAKPLEPVKPEIIAAEPARFKPIEPVPTPPPVVVPIAEPEPPAPATDPAPPPAPIAPAPVEPVAAEPIAPAAAPEPAPEAQPAPTITPTPEVAALKADNLQLLKGVGPKMVALLGGLGVTSYQQIADWTDADVAAIDPQLGAFQGRIARDNIVDQASYLARGDKAGFEAKYGALGGEL